MTCPAEEQLVQFAEGRLDDVTRSAIDSHVDGCSSCRVVLAALQSQPPTGGLSLGSTLASPVSGERAIPGARLRAGDRLGRYEVDGFLGAGAMGEVYLARDPALSRKVALKVLRVEKGRDTPALRARLVREAQAMARLSHPNVVAVYEVGDEGGQVFVAMEFIDGGSLRRWVDQRDWRVVLQACVDAGKGLSAAHARGLIHRDFKPDNVLVGSDGRVKVTDFGLAADVDDEFTETAAPAPDLVDAKLTQTGALIGTPAYMAPEMLEGRKSSAACDQFAFCVSTVEALSGKRPMDGATVGELLKARLRGPQLDQKPPVPVEVWRALERGLALDPAKRFDSMDSLLSVLEGVLVPKRRWPFLVTAAAVVVALGAGGVAWRARTPSCDVPADALAGVWDSTVRERVQAAMSATKVPFADNASNAVRTVLDERAAAWSLARREACEATWVTRTQSPQVLDLRMRCLDRAKEQLGAMAAWFSKADADVVTSTSTVLATLEPLEWCADPKLLAASVTPPTPAQQPAVTKVRDELARTSLLVAARPPAAVDALKPLVETARATQYPPVHAETLAMLAEAHLANSDAKAAEAAAREAATIADAVGDDVDRARALLTLIDAVGPEQARWSDGTSFAKDARAVVQRLGNDARLEALLEVREGKLLYTQSQYSEARTHYERALALRERLFGKDDPAVADVLQFLAICVGSMGKLDDAKAMYERALVIREKSLGPLHPEVAATLNTLGIDASDRGDPQAALAFYQRALDIRVKALGPEHSRVGHVLTNMAGTQMDLGELPAALQSIQRAIAIEEKSMGADHPSLAEPLSTQCLIEAKLGHAKEAEAACERALSITLAKRPATHVRVGLVHLSWGEALLTLGRPKEALVHLEAARAPIAGRVSEEDMYFVELDAAEAEARVALSKEKDAVPIVARLSTSLEKNKTLPADQVARVLMVSAKVQWAMGAKAESAASATRALELLRDLPLQAKTLAAFQTWAGAHGVMP
ncbi:MAG: tetratricopeptide repeat protein [Archangiaceae bacterium]|nr:tetratricopeptide repeat protein [Archangiaceae bacterium]